MGPARGERRSQITQQASVWAPQFYIIASKWAIPGLDQHNLVHTRYLAILSSIVFCHILAKWTFVIGELLRLRGVVE